MRRGGWPQFPPFLSGGAWGSWAFPLPAVTLGRLPRGDVGGNCRLTRGRTWLRGPPRPRPCPQAAGVEARVVGAERSGQPGPDPSVLRPLECALLRASGRCAIMTGVFSDRSRRRAHASRWARPGNPWIHRCRAVAGPRPGATVVSVAPGVPTETGRVGHVAAGQDKVVALALPRQGPVQGIHLPWRSREESCRGGISPAGRGSRGTPGAEASRPRQARCRGTRTGRPGRRCRATCLKFASRRALPAWTLAAVKEATRRYIATVTPNSLEDLILSCYLSEDFQEGVRAFLEKRKADWKGR